MVQLSASSVASPKTPKMGKTKTPKKSSAVVTPAKAEVVKTPKQAKNTPAKAEVVKTPKQAKNTPAKAEVVKTPKQAKNTPAKAEVVKTPKSKNTPKVAPQTPKNGTASAKKSKKVKTPKQKPVEEDVKMASEGEEEEEEEEAAPAQPSPKKSSKKAPVQSEDAEMSSEEEEIKVKSRAPKQTDRADTKTSKFSISIRGINFNSNKDSLNSHFSQFGKVVSCVLPANGNKKGLNRGFGFVAFDSQEALDKALASTHTVDNKSLSVRKSKEQEGGKRKRDESVQRDGDSKRKAFTHDNELFVACLDFASTRETVKKHFSQFGKVVSVSLPTNADESQIKGFGFVSFKDASSMEKAMATPDQVIDGSKVVVTSRKKPVGKEVPIKLSHPNELFVASLHISTQRQTLEKHFSKYGEVSKITLPWNIKEHRNKGFGFISFKSAESLSAALEEDHEIDGKVIAVNAARKDGEKEEVAPAAKKVKADPVAAKMEEDEEEKDSEEGGDEEVEGEEDDDEEEDDVEGEDDEDDDEEVEGEDDDDEVEGEEDDEVVAEAEEDDDDDDDSDDEE